MRGFRDKRRAATSIGKPALWAGAVSGVLLVAAPSASRADSVMAWNNTLLTVIQQTSALLTDGPPEVAREIAMVDGAMYDAVNAATGEKYKPYAYTGKAVPSASADAAALQAGYAVMTSIFTGSAWNGTVPASVLTDITDTYSTARAALGTGPAVRKGLILGNAAANAMIALRANDGSAAAIANGLTTYTPPGEGNPGVYVPPASRPAMFPMWGTVKPFTMTSSTEFAVPPPPAVDSPRYAASVLETECLGSAGGLSSLPSNIQSACAIAASSNNFGLPATAAIDQGTGKTATNSTLALFWNDPGTTVQPPGQWLKIADTVLVDQNVTSELQQARLTAMIGMADADAAIAVWQTKYAYNLWRPITAIGDCAPWNANFTTCDTAWKSVIATPPHPDYLAGHPAFSAAAATVLEDFFGTDNIAFCTTSDQYLNAGTTIAPITLCYDSFTAAAQDATDSRIYGGIHTNYAVNNALVLGDQIAANLVANDFTRIRGPHVCPPQLAAGGNLVAIDVTPIFGNQGCPPQFDAGQTLAASDTALIPEPNSFALLGIPLAGLRMLRRRQCRTRARDGAA
jgi:hypothetical protein